MGLLNSKIRRSKNKDDTVFLANRTVTFARTLNRIYP